MSIDTNNSASTRTVVDWDDAPEGATHCLIKDSGTAWFRFKDDNSFPNTWKDGEWKNVRLPTRKPTPKPATKRLTQAVFDGLPPEYRWAAVDSKGRAYAHKCMPKGVTAAYWLFVRGCAAYLIGEGYDTTNWQNSLIERQDAPKSADIDWSRQDVPEGATHCVPTSAAKYWYKKIGDKFHAYNGTGWNTNHTSEKCVSMREIFEITRPESITDVARSIEEARIEEQSERTYPHYFKDVSDVDKIDVYAVLRLFEVTDPCLQHIVKKALCAGKRGAKNWVKDVQEIADTANRLIELESGK